MAGYYGDERVHESIHFVPPAQRDWFAQHNPGSQHQNVFPYVPEEGVMDTDVCVVGSGAGGAVVAYHAARQGHKVVLPEEGDYIPASEISHDEGKMPARFYKEGGLAPSSDSSEGF